MARRGPQQHECGAADQSSSIQYVEFTRFQGRAHSIFHRLPVSRQTKLTYTLARYVQSASVLARSRERCDADERSHSMTWKRIVPVLALAGAFCGLAAAPLFA